MTLTTTPKLQPSTATSEAFSIDDRMDCFTPKYRYTVYINGELQGTFARHESVERLIRVNMGNKFAIAREVFY